MAKKTELMPCPFNGDQTSAIPGLVLKRCAAIAAPLARAEAMLLSVRKNGMSAL